MWQLAGGGIVSELGRHGLMVTMPPIVSLPKIVLGEGHFQGQVCQNSQLGLITRCDVCIQFEVL